MKEDLDDVIQYNIDKVVCIRFGKSVEVDTLRIDEIVRY